MAGVAVGQVQPETAGGFEHSGNLLEHPTEGAHPVLHSLLQAELTRYPVVPQLVVGRAGDDAVDRPRRQLPEPPPSVADQDGVARCPLHAAPPCTTSTSSSNRQM